MRGARGAAHRLPHAGWAALAFWVGFALILVFAGHPGRASAAAPAPAGEPGRTAAGVPLTLSFPRLGMWWPDTQTQSLSSIARYDWLILGDWNADDAPQIRALRPDIILLNSTNAGEVGYNPDPGADPSENAELRRASARWLLTQVGSTLTTAVSATRTVLPVAAVTTVRAGGPIDLFMPGDTVVIEDELALVQTVNKTAKTLTVGRGAVKPKAAHAAGTRVAAAISFWPQSLVMDLSTACPSAVVSASVGPETWGLFSARSAAALVDDPVWDGMLIDRGDDDQSWLIGDSTARSIDPDRSNRLPADYDAFDASWNEGLRGYVADLRARVGDDEILLANLGMANFDLLNGNNLEGFPMKDGTGYGTPWAQMVFGPHDDGSYLDWLERSRHPNLSTVETYEDDEGADPTGDGSYDNPYERPGFVPDYRKMRFGLTTALLGDGFFSYEINTNGHGSLGLMWFDEYDNVGRGRGYLGQPLGPARRAVGELAAPELLAGGAFDSQSDMDRWDLWADAGAGYAASLARDAVDKHAGASSARITVTQTQGTWWQVALLRQPVSVTKGQEYTLSFWAKADTTRPVEPWVQQASAPWTDRLEFEDVRIGTAWRRYELSAVARAGDPAAALHVGLGQQTGAVWLDDVSLRRGGREVWRRDYEGGSALVNATNATRTVSLGRMFRKIRGRQAPLVNDGMLVTSVSLPPRDGLVLLQASSAEVTASSAFDSALVSWSRASATSYRMRAVQARRYARARSTVDRFLARRARDAWYVAWARASAAYRTTASARRAFRVGAIATARSRSGTASRAGLVARTAIYRASLLGPYPKSWSLTARADAARGLAKLAEARAALATLP